MQRYGDSWLITRNRVDSSSTCCDELGDMRHSKLMHDFCVAKNHKTSILVTASLAFKRFVVTLGRLLCYIRRFH